MCQAPGTCPISYSDACRTSMSSGASSGSPAMAAARSSSDRRPLASTGRPDAAHRSKPPSRWPVISSWPMRSAWRVSTSRSSSCSRTRTIGRSRSTTQPSQVPNESSNGMDNEPGMWPATWVAAATGVDDERAPGDGRLERLGRERGRLGHVRAEQPRAGLVRRAHPGEVARDRRLTGQERARELVDLHRPQERVVATLEADRRQRRRGDPRRTERAGPMCRVDGHEVLHREDDLVEGAVHLVRERDRVGLPEQVGPSDGADEQRTATEEGHRLVGAGRVGEGVDDVLGRVPGRVERGEPQPPDLERRAVGEAAVLVAELGAGPDDVGGTGQGREFAAAGDVVVVEVRLHDADDAQIAGPGGLEVDVDVPTRVDHRRDTRVIVRDQGRQVAEATDRELLDTHRRERSTPSSDGAVPC